jgi:hypothetical protein
MTNRLKTVFASMAAITLLAAAPATGVAQTPEQKQPGGMHEGMHGTMAMGDSGEMMDCKQMMAKMKEMHAKQQQMQAELDELASRMNATSGSTQQEVMAELLTKLVEQRGAMQEMMMKMQPMMMQHMQHMQPSDEGGMSDCPMMQKMQSEKDAEASPDDDDEHSHHH